MNLPHPHPHPCLPAGRRKGRGNIGGFPLAEERGVGYRTRETDTPACPAFVPPRRDFAQAGETPIDPLETFL